VFRAPPLSNRVAVEGALADFNPDLLRFSVPYAALTAVFEAIDATTKRLEISAYLTQFLVDVIDKTPGDLLHVVYLCINRVSTLPVS